MCNLLKITYSFNNIVKIKNIFILRLRNAHIVLRRTSWNWRTRSRS